MARTGKQFAKLTGDYSSINVYATWQLRKQDASTGESTIRLREYLTYSSNGTYGSSYSTFKLQDSTVKSGSYSYSGAGDYLLGYKDIVVKHNEDGSFPDTKLKAYAYSYHFTDKPSKTVTLTSADIPKIEIGSTINEVRLVKSDFDNGVPLNIILDMTLLKAGIYDEELGQPHSTMLDVIINGNSYHLFDDIPSTIVSVYFDETEFQTNGAIDGTHSITPILFPLSWQQICAMIPNKTSIPIEFILTTYDYGSPIATTFYNYFYEVTKANVDFEVSLKSDEQSYSLTGSYNKFIENFGKVIVNANAITSKNGANIQDGKTYWQRKYILDNTDINNPVATETFAQGILSTDNFYIFGDIGTNNSSYVDYSIDVTDSRGYKATSHNVRLPSEEYEVIKYTKPILENATVQRPEQLAPYVYMSISGSFWNNNFGIVQNEIKLQYRYKLNTQEDYTNWLDLDPTINEDGTFSFYGDVGSTQNVLVPANNSATFEIRVIDSTESEAKEINFTIPKGKSMFDLGENYLSWNGELCINDEEVPCFAEENANEDGSRNIQLYDSNMKKIFPNTYKVGDIYISSQNINPEAQFGGTWELIDKEFKEKYSSTEDNLFAINTTNASSAEMSYVRSGHTIRVRVAVDNKVSLSDTDVTLGTLDIQSLGFTTFISTPNIFSYINDDVMGICYYVYNTGELKWRGLISSTATSLGSGATITTDMVAVLTPAYMLDEFCDRFYWKRIS